MKLCVCFTELIAFIDVDTSLVKSFVLLFSKLLLNLSDEVFVNVDGIINGGNDLITPSNSEKFWSLDKKLECSGSAKC